MIVNWEKEVEIKEKEDKEVISVDDLNYKKYFLYIQILLAWLLLIL